MRDNDNWQGCSDRSSALVTFARRTGVVFLVAALAIGYALPGAIGTQAAGTQHSANKQHIHHAHAQQLAVHGARPIAVHTLAQNHVNWLWYVEHAPQRTYQGTVVQMYTAQRVVVVLSLNSQLFSVQVPRNVTMANVHAGSRLVVQARIWQNIGQASALRIIPMTAAPVRAFPPVGQGTVSVAGTVIGIGSNGVMSLSPGPVNIRVTPQTRFLTSVLPGSRVHVITYWANGVLIATIIQATTSATSSAPVPVPVGPITVPAPIVPSQGPAAPLPGATYGGRAYGASLSGNVVADTGALPASGGTIGGFAGLLDLRTATYHLVAPTVPGAAAIARVSAGGSNVTSVGTLLNFRLTVGSVVVSADTVEAEAFAQCVSAPHGQTVVANLRITGISPALAFNGSANQTFSLPNNLGTLTVNEQSISGSSITVNALHIHTSTGQDYILGSAQASLIGCAVPSATAIQPVATATSIPVAGISAAGANVAGSPIAASSSCNTTGFAATINQQGSGYNLVAPTVPGAAALSQIVCSGQGVTGTGTALNAVFIVNGVSVQADTAQAQAFAQCGVAPRGTVTITGLRVNGSPVTMTGLPNQTIGLPNNQGTVTINEQIINGATITVNAVDVRTASGQSIVLGTATAAPFGCPAAQPGATSTPIAATISTPGPASINTPISAAVFPVTIVGFIVAHTNTSVTVAWGAERFIFRLGSGAANLVGLPLSSLVVVQGTWSSGVLSALSGSTLTASALNNHLIAVVGRVVLASSQKVILSLAGKNITIEVTTTTPGLSNATVGRMVSIQGTIAGAMYLASQISPL